MTTITTSEAEAALDDFVDRLPDDLVTMSDYSDDGADTHFATWARDYGAMGVYFGPNGAARYTWAIPNYGAETIETTRDDEAAEERFLAAVAAFIAAQDPWECHGDYGYADRTVIGTDTFEDPVGMEKLKRELKLDPSWHLVKCRNFGGPGRTLTDMEEWLKEFTNRPYRRVGWTSGCSTKVGVAFEDGVDAVYFKMVWYI